MTKQLVRFVVLVAAASLISTPSLMARTRHLSDRPVALPASKVPFKPMIPGVSMMVLKGNPKTGPHTALTKFDRGHWNPPHSHSHNMWIVVVSGTLVTDIDGRQKRLGPGSFVFEPAGVKHSNGAGQDSDCVFVGECDGPFDLKWYK